MKWILCMFGKHDAYWHRQGGVSEDGSPVFVFRCRHCETVLEMRAQAGEGGE